MTEFTPWSGLLGGALIGLAAVILMAGLGRVMGASGILAGLLTIRFDAGTRWRLTFILAMLIGASWTALFFFESGSLHLSQNPMIIVISGLLVGVGTMLGSGCTSGHGICGLARFSMRSLVATFIFMTAAVATTFIMRHVLGI
jgi:uncharacterized protein